MTDDMGLGRRQLLRSAGGLAGAAVLSGTTLASASNYDRVVNIVDAGADPTGEEPIDDVLGALEADDTLVEFPNGEYKLDQINLYGRENFGMRGVGDDVTLVAEESHGDDFWIAGASTSDIVFENFTIDTTADGTDPSIQFGTYGGLVVRDIDKVGAQDGAGVPFGFRTYNSGSEALVENVSMTDGGDGHGFWVDGNGTITFRDCHVHRFGDNGLYASWADGAVQVEGGTYKNNDRTQVRLGGEDSYAEGVEIVVDDPIDVHPQLGVRVSNGLGPVEVRDCDILMQNGRGSGGIVVAENGGAIRVDNCRIEIGDEYHANKSGGSRNAPAIYIDYPPNADYVQARIQDTSMVGGGGGDHYPAVLSRRDATDIDRICVDWDGSDGVWFQSDGNTLYDSTVDVPGDVFGGDADVAGISTSGSCPAPDFGDGSGGGDGGDDGGDGDGGSASLADAPVPGNADYLDYPVMGTDSDNPTLTVYGNFVYPNTRKFAMNNLPEIMEEYVLSGDLNVEFRSIAYPDGHYLNTTEGEERLAQLALGTWDKDWSSYWGLFEYLFENQGDFEWGSYSEARSLLNQNDVRTYGWIPALAGDDEWSDEVVDSRRAAADAGLSYVPQVELDGDLAGANWDTGHLLTWIGNRL
ncbi:hypothetical protein [Haloarchaeobius sp. DFWS5]|uniref:hypothetical protein n=1 Tax=Haloarchaeobius sp. DFWS5 TaxID=3446114 RepID=UPI003EB969B6